MALNPQLNERSNGACELCMNAESELNAYTVTPKQDDIPENQVVLCAACNAKIAASDYTDVHYWRCLEGSIWSEVPSVQVLSYRLLTKLVQEDWANDAAQAVYLDEPLLEWANAEARMEAEKVVHKDSFGSVLEAGDTVVLTQNLNVKGTNYIAPKGTIVRKIKLVADNGEQIEGKINGDTIVILTKFVKKSV